MDREALINGIRVEQYKDVLCNVPIDVFPTTIQKIILDMMMYEDYKIEYLIACLISSAATAIGNSCHIRVKSEWTSAPSTYFMLVGRPGMGKTHPLNYAYAPLRKQDELEHKRYEDALQEYERQLRLCDKNAQRPIAPSVKYNIISDFTPEAMMLAHARNKRGIAILVDELAALFKTSGRYSGKSDLIEKLLTAYSGQPLFSIRKTDAHSLYIKSPCINLIGSIQTNLIGDYIRGEYQANGLVDRFLFAFPHDKKMKRWSNAINQVSHKARNQWNTIIEKLQSIPCEIDAEGNVAPRILNMDDSAAARFAEWYNGLVDVINAIEDDSMVDSRMCKQNDKVARVALVMQMLRWATEGVSCEVVELESIEAAIRIVDFFEDCYRRIVEDISRNESTTDRKTMLFRQLPERFTAGDAIPIASGLGICNRSLYDYLDAMCHSNPPVLRKEGERRNAVYTKCNAVSAVNAVCSQLNHEQYGTQISSTEVHERQ